TFGFETARAVGTTIVESLMVDARTTGRWYLAISMGRKYGSLALSMCKSSGATLAVILEEFHGERFDLSLVVDTIVGAIIKRRAEGYDDGGAGGATGLGGEWFARGRGGGRERGRRSHGPRPPPQRTAFRGRRLRPRAYSGHPSRL